MMISSEKVYRSKVSLSIMLPLALLLLSVEIFMIAEQMWPGAILIVVSMLFIVYLYFDTSYTITADGKLIVKCGFLIKREMNINSIKKIKATNNPLSAPAFSLDRIEISYNKYDTVLISPEHKAEFIQQLRQINPDILVA